MGAPKTRTKKEKPRAAHYQFCEVTSEAFSQKAEGEDSHWSAMLPIVNSIQRLFFKRLYAVGEGYCPIHSCDASVVVDEQHKYLVGLNLWFWTQGDQLLSSEDSDLGPELLVIRFQADISPDKETTDKRKSCSLWKTGSWDLHDNQQLNPQKLSLRDFILVLVMWKPSIIIDADFERSQTSDPWEERLIPLRWSRPSQDFRLDNQEQSVISVSQMVILWLQVRRMKVAPYLWPLGIRKLWLFWDVNPFYLFGTLHLLTSEKVIERVPRDGIKSRWSE